MKLTTSKGKNAGLALLITVIMMAVALATLGGVLAWTTSGSRMTYRFNQYGKAEAAAEGATEKVLTSISRDFLSGGLATINGNLASYRQMTLTSNDSPYWADWVFTDATGNTNRTYVQFNPATTYVSLNSIYNDLKGYVNPVTLLSNARQTTDQQRVSAGIYQQIQLAQIPLFQFVMYTTGDMEISCGQPFNITGRVHSNSKLYVEPDSTLTFMSDVTSVGDLDFSRAPLDSRGNPVGSAVYEVDPATVTALSLPIGTNNSPAAVREIIQPPPAGELAGSALGQLRYYNQVDMLIIVSNSGVTARSGLVNNFASIVPAAQVATFLTLSNSFLDARENKTVKPVDINIGAFRTWAATDTTIRPLISRGVTSIYVLDYRTLTSAQLSAVRVSNGQSLPVGGLTVATPRPMYVLGNYNQLNSGNLGTSNTLTTLPASLVADSVTVLSTAWTDAESTDPVASRVAGPTTVNAAIIAGSVPTSNGNYSGGMENFPRFLETWGSTKIFTYNGALINMFPSQYATNIWGKANVYNPPARNWNYDRNFEDPAKLPPHTPSMLRVIRGQWASIAPNTTTAP